MVAEDLSDLVQPLPPSDGGPNRLLGLVNLFGDRENPLLMRPWKDHHAVGIAHEQVASGHPRLSDRYGYIEGLDLDTILAGAHPMPAREDRIPQGPAQMNVTADAVDHSTSQAAPMRDLGQNVAPHGDVLATTVIEYYHFTLTDIIDVVADRANRDAWRAIKKGPRTPYEAELRIPRRNSPALSNYP
jgi:hypothetical protein